MEINVPKPKGVSEMSISKIKVDIEATVEEPESDAEADGQIRR